MSRWVHTALLVAIVLLSRSSSSQTNIALPEPQEIPQLPPTPSPIPLAVSMMPAEQFEALTGRVVLYNWFTMGWWSEGDLVVKTMDGKTLVHLLYSPFDFGFDAPAAKPEQIMPEEMIRDGSIVWTFRVHPPLNDSENDHCAPLPLVVKDRNGKPIPIDRNRYSPISEKMEARVPLPEGIPCLIVAAWSKAAPAQ